MRHRLKLTLALAALQLCAALPLSARVADAAAVQRRGRSRVSRRVSQELLPGSWGGDHIRFDVIGRGATIEFDCARATIYDRVEADARGRFAVYGRYYEEHGGPVRPGDGAVSYNVRVSGVVGGSLMRLTVRHARTGKLIGTYHLTRDREANLFKCR